MSSKNKMIKSAVAGVTGVALLAGGFGSFALWSEQKALPSQSISVGDLGVTAGIATYADQSPDATDTTWDPATDKMVPGDTVQVTLPLDVVAVGKNLKGTLDLVKPSTFGGQLTVTYDVVPQDTDTTLAGVQPKAGVTDNGANAADAFVARNLGGGFNATGTVTFHLASTADLATTENANVALNEAAFRVAQSAR